MDIADPTLGQLLWSTTANEVGNYSIAVRVEDGRGGFDEQHFVLSVVDVPNRPPHFTTTPGTHS